MNERGLHRWFQISLKSLFLFTLLVATFFAGYTLARRPAEAERQRAELEARRAAEESRLKTETLLQQAEYQATVAKALQWAARQQAAKAQAER